jgi:fumarylacetoacetase
LRLNFTHDAGATSWVASANAASCDFPIQNLPYSVFRPGGSGQKFRGGIAIGDKVLDLGALSFSGVLQGRAAEAAASCNAETLDVHFAQGPDAWQALRHAVFGLLNSKTENAYRKAVEKALVPIETAEFKVPTRVGDYTDFLSSYHHLVNCSRLMSNFDNAIPANFHAMPLAYHGRSSSVVISGTALRRPRGQILLDGDIRREPSQRLDYECELGVFIGTGNDLGSPISLDEAASHVFGMCLLNDWSSRDIQTWEMYPLGPFASKNFGTSISPWIVTAEALEPFRCEWTRDSSLPQPLPYLDSPKQRQWGGLAITLEVLLNTQERSRAHLPPQRISGTSFTHTHWTVAQLIAQHTANGCNFKPGDLVGTGTISGPSEDEAGALLELARGGKKPLEIGGGSQGLQQRSFLQDGDSVMLKAWCEAPGQVRIGFGECVGTILPALPA